ncbi:unnamed protein product [Gadus morhua 'NCC']
MLASLVTQQRASAQRCLREGGEAQNHRLTSITACLTCPSVAPLASRHTPAGVSSTDVLVTGPSSLPTYCDTSPGCGDLHAGPNDPGLTSGSRIGSAQPTCCQQLLLRNGLPSSLSDKGSAGQDNRSLAQAVHASCRV